MHARTPARALDRLSSRDRTHAPAQATRHARAWFTPRAARTAHEELAPLVDDAARLDLDDDAEAAELRERAHRSTSRLSAAGLLPPHLVVGPCDPAVVVVRTLAAASRAVTPKPLSDHEVSP